MIDRHGSRDELPAYEDLADLAELVRAAAAATAVLWRASGLDGDRTVRLVEVSHALQRASLALADAVRIGGREQDERPCITGPASAGLAVGGVEVPVGLVWFDGSGAVEVNAAWTALTGLDRARSLGDGWIRAFESGSHAVPSETIAGAMRDGVSTVVEWPLRGDEDRRWVSATIHGSPSAATMAVLDLTDRVARERDLERRASHDRLTGLANRDLLVDRIIHALARLERHRGQCALLFIDLDQFKSVNDRHGHRAGDRLLASLGQRMREAVRPSDTVARFGGDEFVVLCEDLASEAEAVEIGERLLAAILATAEPAGVFGCVTASIGVAFAAGPGDNAHELIDRADRAMYDAKARGGDTICREPARTPAARNGDETDRHRAAARSRATGRR